HRVDDQGRHPVSRADPDARGQGHGVAGPHAAPAHHCAGAVSPSLAVSAVIAAPPNVVMKAFFEPDALRAWWQVSHAVTTPRPLGPYAIEWPPTDFRDEVLGRLGGVFRGTVMECRHCEGFFVGDALWL